MSILVVNTPTAGMKQVVVFFILVFTACSSQFHIEQHHSATYTINSDSIITDTSMDSLVMPYKQKLDLEMNEVIGTNAAELIKEKPESSLGNFFSDACLSQINYIYKLQNKQPVDFAFFNYGGIRKSTLNKGPVTVGMIYEIMPFENELVVLEINDTIMQQLFSYFATKGDNPVSGIRYKIINKELSEVEINGKPYQKDKTYKVLTSDYLSNGGDQLYFLTTGCTVTTTGIKIRDALIELIKKLTLENKKINSEKDGRVRYN